MEIAVAGASFVPDGERPALFFPVLVMLLIFDTVSIVK